MPLVLALAGYNRVTLWRRQRANLMPLPIDRGGQGGIYDRDAVLKALGMASEQTPSAAVDVWQSDPDAYKAAGEAMRNSRMVGRWHKDLQAERSAKKARKPASSAS